MSWQGGPRSQTTTNLILMANPEDNPSIFNSWITPLRQYRVELLFTFPLTLYYMQLLDVIKCESTQDPLFASSYYELWQLRTIADRKQRVLCTFTFLVIFSSCGWKEHWKGGQQFQIVLFYCVFMLIIYDIWLHCYLALRLYNTGTHLSQPLKRLVCHKFLACTSVHEESSSLSEEFD